MLFKTALVALKRTFCETPLYPRFPYRCFQFQLSWNPYLFNNTLRGIIHKPLHEDEVQRIRHAAGQLRPSPE